jgi:hypothetical protein
MSTALIAQRRHAGVLARHPDESGQATAEYAVVILVGIAFAMAVFLLITGGTLNGALGGLLKNVLSFAETMIH